MRRLVLPDGVWRYRVTEGRYDRDECRTPVSVELRTPGGRRVDIGPDEVVREFGHPLRRWAPPAVTPGRLRSWIERNRP